MGDHEIPVLVPQGNVISNIMINPIMDERPSSGSLCSSLPLPQEKIEEWAIGVLAGELEGKEEIVRKASPDLPKGNVATMQEQRRRLDDQLNLAGGGCGHKCDDCPWGSVHHRALILNGEIDSPNYGGLVLKNQESEVGESACLRGIALGHHTSRSRVSNCLEWTQRLIEMDEQTRMIGRRVARVEIPRDPILWPLQNDRWRVCGQGLSVLMKSQSHRDLSG